MHPSEQPLDELLETALHIANREEREKWLEEVLGHDRQKLTELRSLVFSAEKTLWIDTPLQSVREELNAPEPLGEVQIGPFELLRFVGRGGMGEVYLARQHHPVQRLVAIKVIQQELESEQLLERFRFEQQTLANMEHPNIARIIDAGVTESGAHYIAMEYVHGPQLLEYIRSEKLDLRGRIQLVLQICLAIQHAHQKGTIHRDIKPSNVLVSIVDGKPLVKVIDFGVSKACNTQDPSDTALEQIQTPRKVVFRDTYTGVSPGTPRFMSPEQYASNGKGIDTRSDIYSLGALLYNVLVDAPPFDGVPVEELSFDQLKEIITQKDPIAPSQRSPQKARELKGDLDAIVLKAMRRQPENRYQTVSELYDDLQSHLNDLPVKAYPGSPLAQAIKLCRRHKIFFASTSLAIFGLLSGLVFSIVQERKAMESERVAQRRSYGSDLLLASMAISKRNYALSAELLGRQSLQARSTVSGEGNHDGKRLDWRFLSSQLPVDPATILQVPTKLYFGLQLPDRDEIACGAKDSHLRVAHRTTGAIRLDIDTNQKEINGLARSPDGNVLATAGDDGSVKLWNVESGNQVGQFQASTEPVYQVGWIADGKRFLTAGVQPHVSVWSTPDFALNRLLESSNEALECLDVGPQGQVAYGSDRGVIRIAYLSDSGRDEIQNLTVFTSRALNVNRVSTVTFSPSGKMLAVGLNNGYLILLRERNSRYHIVERVRFPTTVTAIAFAPDESKIGLGEDNGSVHLMNLPEDWPTSSRLVFTKYFFDENVSLAPEIDPANPETLWRLVTKTDPSDPENEIPLEIDRVYLEFQKPLKNIFFSDNYVREWTDDAGNTKPEWKEIPKGVIFKEDGIELQFENRYRGWSDLNQLIAQRRLSSWSPHTKRIASLCWNAEKDELISFSEDGAIRTVRTDVSKTMKVGGEDIKVFVPLRDGKVALHTMDDQAYVLKLSPHHNEPSSSILFPPLSVVTSGFAVDDSGGLLVPVTSGNTKPQEPNIFTRWNLQTQAESIATELDDQVIFRFLVGHLRGECVAIVAVDPETATSTEGQKISLASWDLANRKMKWKTLPRNHAHRILKTSPDGNYISYVEERTVRIIDANSGSERIVDDFSGMHVSSTCFSPDERFLVVAISDNSLVCYRISDRKIAWKLRTAGSPISDLAWSRDSVTLVGVSQDGFLRTFDTQIAQMTSEISVDLKNPIGVKLSPEEDWIFILGRDGTLIRMPCGRRLP
jgi:serine/threonine protein kinase/WD40 repeat protein